MDTKSKKSKSILGLFLSLIYAFGIIGLVFSIIVYLIFPNFILIKPSIFMLLFSIVAYCCALAIAHQLIKLNDTVDTVICKTPFIMENVKRMQKIAIYLFVISSYVFTKDSIGQSSHIFRYVFDKSGLNTDAECLIFVLLGLFVLIFAKIFRTAIKIKNENDLTV